MNRVCAWCGVELTHEARPHDRSRPTTHGVCDACRAHFFATRAEPSEAKRVNPAEPKEKDEAK
jgi:hypothetical protein